MKFLHTIRHGIRRQAVRMIGKGPWRTLPLKDMATSHTEELTHGAEVPERFSGILCRDHSEVECYGNSHRIFEETTPPLQFLAGQRTRFMQTGLVPPHEVRTWILSDMMVSGEDGAVWCPHSRALLLESSRGWTRPAGQHPLLATLQVRTTRRLEGLSANLASLGSENFYHFLNDSLARLACMREWKDLIDWFIVGGSRTPQREAWLQAADVPPGKTVWLENGQTLHCQQLIGTDLPLHTSRPTQRQVKRLRELFRVLPVETTPAGMIWISRADSGTRHLEWEDELLGSLPMLQKVQLSGLTPADQIQLFSSAAVIAAPHGAGLSNLAWTHPGGHLIELFPTHHPIDPLYGRWASVVGWHHSHAYVDFKKPTGLKPLVETIKARLDSISP